MPRRNNPFGPRNRPLPIKQRQLLSKKKIKTLNVSVPAEAPMARYESSLKNYLKPSRSRAGEVLSGLFSRYGGESERNGILGFIGEFLYSIGLLRSEKRSEEEAVSIAGQFTAEVNRDQSAKFKRDTSRVGLQVIADPFEKKSEGKNVAETLAVSVFQNVSLISNLDTKYFNDIQRMVFSQIGIELPEPKQEIPGKKNNRMSKKKVLQPTPVEEPQVFSAADIIQLALKSELKPVPSKTSMIEKLSEMDGISKERAELIARDQTQKVFSALEEARGRDAGMVWYMWSGSNDNRERETHVKNNNKIFHVDFPPEETGPPGQDVSCRCRRRWLVSKSQIMNIKEESIGYTNAGTRKKVIEKLRAEKER